MLQLKQSFENFCHFLVTIIYRDQNKRWQKLSNSWRWSSIKRPKHVALMKMILGAKNNFFRKHYLTKFFSKMDPEPLDFYKLVSNIYRSFKGNVCKTARWAAWIVRIQLKSPETYFNCLSCVDRSTGKNALPVRLIAQRD